ncbi:MAG: hypothetical protein JRJ37_04045 [Deltaproteobacteria bacterium]|nr:hypothetical protein [Deltaproteobacteria bacterium]
MRNLIHFFCAAAMLSVVVPPTHAVESYGNPEDPVVAEVLGMQIRTKDPVEMQFVIGQQLFQNYAKENKIEASQEDIDLYVAKMDQFMRDDPVMRDERNKREAAREAKIVEIQQQLKSGSIPAEQKKQLQSELATLENLPKQEREDMLKIRLPMAKGTIEQWMVNKALYQQYGGRIIYQQGGPEPLDAMRDYLKEQQQKGSFKILEKSFEAPFWEYYINDSKHDFFKQGSEEERQAFGTPPWLKKQSE